MKYIIYTAGLLILTFGIGLTIQSDFGTSPYDALLVGLHKTIGLTVGSWEVVVALALVIINAIMAKERPYLLGLITAIVTGLGIDLWLFLLQWLEPTTWPTQLTTFIFGLIFTGLGTAVYLQAQIAPMPMDHTMLLIRELTGQNLFVSRTIIYVVLLIAAYLFHGPIGIGTLLTVCLGGPILNGFAILFDKFPLNRRKINIKTEKEGDE